ncbi:MAG TPA: nucleotidyltransferase domain-containing protein [Chloroflexota bacterium]|nr:nucleotidyltransferase domain-containing protein [Chloroflexota bacterium]
MDPSVVPAEVTATGSDDALLCRFARLMEERYCARVYLFGSRARGTAGAQSDYDLVAVSPTFRYQSRFRRCLDRDEVWLAAGGWRKALDLHCYTPAEFRGETAGGLGYLGHAKRQGELLRIFPTPGQSSRGRGAACRQS